MIIEIYRFGHYINAVESNEDLREWLLANVPDDKMLPTTPLVECMRIASLKDFTFRVDSRKERMDKILKKVRIEDVARSFVELKERGKNFIFDCPICGGKKSGYISPKHQLYKCFRCGRTGTVVGFVMEVKNLTCEEALEYLEKTYNIK